VRLRPNPAFQRHAEKRGTPWFYIEAVKNPISPVQRRKKWRESFRAMFILSWESPSRRLISADFRGVVDR
jgi:hypothetical protein